MPAFGKILVITGLAIAAIGGFLVLSGKIPWLGRLPGDISFRRGNFSFYFPLATSILLSLLLSLAFWLFRK
jgi:hypothetical protein